MYASKELINAFRRAAQELEYGWEIWNWGSFTSCNCSLIAKQLGLEEFTLLASVFSSSSWTHFSKKWTGTNHNFWINPNLCLVTNSSVEEVINTLSCYGITPNDMIELENCLNLNEGVDELISYYKKTADQLESQLLNQSVRCKEEIKQTVSLKGE